MIWEENPLSHPTQPHRFAALETPLGADRLLLVEASVSESLAQPFVIEIVAVALEPIRPEELLGRRVTLRLDLEEEGARYFNGHVFRVGEEEPEGRFWPYTLTVRPWLWFLTRTTDCRIFQHKTVPEIVQAIFREHGFTDFEDKLSGNYPRLEYCVQYRETDFNFIQRLLEQEGIYYYFRHEKERHVLVLADAPEAHEEIPGKIGYHLAGGAAVEEPHIMSFRTEKVVRPGRVILNDFDFEKPNAKLEAQSADKRPHERSDFEVYDYPGEYTEVDQGERYARVRIEELQARYEEARGGSDVRLFSAGRLFQLACRDPEMAARLDGKYLLVEVHHTFSTGGYFSDEPGGASYHNSFTAIPARVPFRPERRTPKPVIQGPQTAIVVGPKGEEIHTDEYGRVKVQFHWDRYGKRDENSSCWVRVAQVWAGKNWGGIHIPRIDQEVIVEFLEGDPDRPIITGRVYNAEQMPPYELPAHKTRSGIKSRSSKDGSPKNFNEIRFEDKKGREEICIHAERNLRITVENDEIRRVGGDRTTTIEKNDTLQIKQGKRETTLNRGDDILTLDQGSRATTLSMGSDTLKVNMGDITHEASVGTYTIKAMNVEINGITSIKLVCGASTIEMNPAMVTIKAPLVKIN